MRHEYDYPFTDKSIAMRSFMAGSLLYITAFFPNIIVQPVSLALAVFIIFDSCLPFGQYFFLATVIFSGLLGALLSYLIDFAGYLPVYWLLLLALTLFLLLTRRFRCLK